MADGSRAGDEARHGFLIGDIPVLIPQATRSQYLPDSSVFPVPRATAHLRGLIHWRGQAVVAIDGADPPATELPIISTCNLLLIGSDDDAIAFVQSGPPGIVQLAEGDASPTKPECWLSDALLDSRLDASKQIWWEFDPVIIAQCMHNAQLTEDHATVSSND